ncbi:hypothetical protein [Microvirga sp. VF16]|uniref:hypothetical protein n=1 Tax=Microvirga sp. VF16 TaxID=2807101 RepID=UPI00193E8B74|nr:hypothetical protein [Microvirga sp. VF16]QRM34862.1 hypothetical protein JO965_42130 [Microvirga sp. VF16]
MVYLVPADWNKAKVEASIQTLWQGGIQEFAAFDPTWRRFLRGVDRPPGNKIKLKIESHSGYVKSKVEDIESLEAEIRKGLLRPWRVSDIETYKKKRISLGEAEAKSLSLAIVERCFRDPFEPHHECVWDITDSKSPARVKVLHAGGEMPWRSVRRLGPEQGAIIRLRSADGLYSVLRNLHHPDYFTAYTAIGGMTGAKWDAPRFDSQLHIELGRKSTDLSDFVLDEETASTLSSAIVWKAFACGEMLALETGESPITEKGDYSDVRVIDGEAEFPWLDVGLITQDEMRSLMRALVNRVYTILRGLPNRETVERYKEFGFSLQRAYGAPFALRHLDE